MKIVFARDGEVLICGKCGRPLETNFHADEDGDEDFRWCDGCVDYVDSKVLKR